MKKIILIYFFLCAALASSALAWTEAGLAPSEGNAQSGINDSWAQAAALPNYVYNTPGYGFIGALNDEDYYTFTIPAADNYTDHDSLRAQFCAPAGRNDYEIEVYRYNSGTWDPISRSYSYDGVTTTVYVDISQDSGTDHSYAVRVWNCNCGTDFTTASPYIITMAVVDTGYITGTVNPVGAGASGKSGINVYAYSGNTYIGSSTTDGAGYYSVRAPVGVPIDAFTASRNWYTGCASDWAYGETRQVFSPAPVVPSAGAAVSGNNFKAYKEGVLSGTATGGEDVRIRLLRPYGSNYESQYTQENINGAYVFHNLAPGTYRVWVEPMSGRTSSQRVSYNAGVTVTDGMTTTLNFGFLGTGRTISGSLDPVPPAGGFVMVNMAGSRASGLDDWDPFRDYYTTMVAGGAYSISGLPDGTYDFRAGISGSGSGAWYPHLNTSVSSDLTMDFSGPSPVTFIAGTIFDSTGTFTLNQLGIYASLTGASDVFGVDSVTYMGTVDASGQYSVMVPPEFGYYGIGLLQGGGNGIPAMVCSIASAVTGTSGNDMTITAGVSISGEILINSKPILYYDQGAMLSFFDMNGPRILSIGEAGRGSSLYNSGSYIPVSTVPYSVLVRAKSPFMNDQDITVSVGSSDVTGADINMTANPAKDKYVPYAGSLEPANNGTLVNGAAALSMIISDNILGTGFGSINVTSDSLPVSGLFYVDLGDNKRQYYFYLPPAQRIAGSTHAVSVQLLDVAGNASGFEGGPWYVNLATATATPTATITPTASITPTPTPTPVSCMISGTVTLPASSSGRNWTLIVDTDFNGGNGMTAITMGTTDGNSYFTYSVAVPEGTYNIYAIVDENGSGGPPNDGDYIAVYGGTWPSSLPPPNASVTCPAGGTFDMTAVVMAFPTATSTPTPGGCDITGTVYLSPVPAAGINWTVIVDTDMNGGNGWAAAVGGMTDGSDHFHYSVSTGPGVYNIYAIVDGNGAVGPPDAFDYIAIYGGTWPYDIPGAPNAPLSCPAGAVRDMTAVQMQPSPTITPYAGTPTITPTFCALSGTITLPAGSVGKAWAVVIDSDYDGGNGMIGMQTGFTSGGSAINYSLLAAEGTYYLYAMVDEDMSGMGGGPTAGDYFGYFGGPNYYTPPAAANADVTCPSSVINFYIGGQPTPTLTVTVTCTRTPAGPTATPEYSWSELNLSNSEQPGVTGSNDTVFDACAVPPGQQYLPGGGYISSSSDQDNFRFTIPGSDNYANHNMMRVELSVPGTDEYVYYRMHFYQYSGAWVDMSGGGDGASPGNPAVAYIDISAWSGSDHDFDIEIRSDNSSYTTQHPYIIRISIVNTGLISGQAAAIGASASGAGDIVISAYAGSESLSTATTDAGGNYQVWVPVGVEVTKLSAIRAWYSGCPADWAYGFTYYLPASPLMASYAGQDISGTDFNVYKEGVLTGTVFTSQNVNLTMHDQYTGSYEISGPGSYMYNFSGPYTIHNLAPGSYGVLVEPVNQGTGLAISYTANVRIRDGFTEVINYTMAAGYTVSGTFNPPATYGGEVSVYPAGGNRRMFNPFSKNYRANITGNAYTITGLPAGTYDFGASSGGPSMWNAAKNVTISGPATVNFTGPVPDTQISGTIIDYTGRFDLSQVVVVAVVTGTADVIDNVIGYMGLADIAGNFSLTVPGTAGYYDLLAAGSAMNGPPVFVGRAYNVVTGTAGVIMAIEDGLNVSGALRYNGKPFSYYLGGSLGREGALEIARDYGGGVFKFLDYAASYDNYLFNPYLPPSASPYNVRIFAVLPYMQEQYVDTSISLDSLENVDFDLSVDTALDRYAPFSGELIPVQNGYLDPPSAALYCTVGDNLLTSGLNSVSILSDSVPVDNLTYSPVPGGRRYSFNLPPAQQVLGSTHFIAISATDANGNAYASAAPWVVNISGATPTVTDTPQFTATETPTITPTWTNSEIATATDSPTATGTSTATETATNSPTYTVTRTVTSTRTLLVTRTMTPTFTESGTITVTPTVTDTPVMPYISGTITLPFASTGRECVVVLDNDNNGGNGFIYIWSGTTDGTNSLNYYISGAAGTYYLFAYVDETGDGIFTGGPDSGDYFGYYGGGPGPFDAPGAANAVVMLPANSYNFSIPMIPYPTATITPTGTETDTATATPTETPVIVTVSGTIVMPAVSTGHDCVVVLDNDTNGGNGILFAWMGTTNGTNQFAYSMTATAGTYYLFAFVDESGTGIWNGPAEHDYFGFYGGGPGPFDAPGAANALVAGSAVTFNFGITEIIYPTSTITETHTVSPTATETITGTPPTETETPTDSPTATATASMTPTNTETISLEEGLDNFSLAFTTGGDAAWLGQTAVSWYGGDAGQSGVIGNSQSTYFAASVSGPGQLKFNYKVSSEEWSDYFRFLIDGTEQMAMTGEWGWFASSLVYNVAGAGPHTFTWLYEKDAAGSGGLDRAWVDRVEFILFTATSTATPTRTATPTATETVTPTDSPTLTATPEDTFTATGTFTGTYTVTETYTATGTWTQTGTPTVTGTSTATGTDTPTVTGTDTPTSTDTHTPTATPTDTDTATPTVTGTDTPASTDTHTPTATPTDTDTATSTVTGTDTPTATDTHTPTATPTGTGTATQSVTETITPTGTDTGTPSATPSSTATDTPTGTATPTDTDTATLTCTATGTMTRTITATVTETASPSLTPTETGTPTVTATISQTETVSPTPAKPDAEPGKPYCYPQPAGDTLHIVYALTTAEEVTIRFYNFAGTPVASMTHAGIISNSNTADMDLTKFSPGIYYYVIKRGTALPMTGKFLVVK